uniref:Translin-associated protein X n=2 Tax=Perdicinae TaxID=466544 RepID=A0A8C2STS0_COTJA
FQNRVRGAFHPDFSGLHCLYSTSVYKPQSYEVFLYSLFSGLVSPCLVHTCAVRPSVFCSEIILCLCSVVSGRVALLWQAEGNGGLHSYALFRSTAHTGIRLTGAEAHSCNCSTGSQLLAYTVFCDNHAVKIDSAAFQLELDTRHDKYERLVKLSRDITIESKRTIFLLHRYISAPNGEEVLNESEVKLDAVRRKIKQVAQELIGEDMYQFHRAISPGLQEYIEAVSFQYFIKTRSLISVEEINKQLIFTTEDREETTNTPSSSQDKQPHTWSLKVTPVDYLLGVADLTGELMRLCISSVGNGDIDTPFELSQFLRQIYDGFTFIGNTGPYEVSKKLYTLKQSLAKVENACYTLKVRGSEIPKHMLADVFSTKTELIDQEEGLS